MPIHQTEDSAIERTWTKVRKTSWIFISYTLLYISLSSHKTTLIIYTIQIFCIYIHIYDHNLCPLHFPIIPSQQGHNLYGHLSTDSLTQHSNQRNRPWKSITTALPTKTNSYPITLDDPWEFHCVRTHFLDLSQKWQGKRSKKRFCACTETESVVTLQRQKTRRQHKKTTKYWNRQRGPRRKKGRRHFRITQTQRGYVMKPTLI